MKAYPGINFVFGSRPKFEIMISEIAHGKENSIAYVCGPQAIVDQVSVFTQECGILFHHETFELQKLL